MSHRSQMKAMIRSGRSMTGVTSLTIDPSELYVNTEKLSWEDDNQEIVYNNMRYDIVSVIPQKGALVLYLLSDQIEKDLQDTYASANDDKQQAGNPPVKILKQLLALKFLPDALFGFDNTGGHSSLSYSSYTEQPVSVLLPKEILPPIL